MAGAELIEPLDLGGGEGAVIVGDMITGVVMFERRLNIAAHHGGDQLMMTPQHAEGIDESAAQGQQGSLPLPRPGRGVAQLKNQAPAKRDV